MPHLQTSHSAHSEASYHNMTIGRIPSVEGGIQPTIFDAKADLLTATAADTPARLAVGTDGQVLSADSTTSTGLKWIPAGKILQVVNATYSTAVTIASTTYADTGLSATITPILSTSKILVIFNQTFEMYRSSTYQGVGIKLFRGATQIFDAEGAYITGAGSIEAGGATAVRNSQVTSYSYLDSPATTSATTYKTQGRVRETANSGGVIFQNGDSKSLMTLIEVAV